MRSGELLLTSSPHTYAEMNARGRTDAELTSILEHVHLAYLPSREGGWDTRKEWKDVLSGGEKQRVSRAPPRCLSQADQSRQMGMARLL